MIQHPEAGHIGTPKVGEEALQRPVDRRPEVTFGYRFGGNGECLNDPHGHVERASERGEVACPSMRSA
jgi:hypothetical protein